MASAGHLWEQEYGFLVSCYKTFGLCSNMAPKLRKQLKRFMGLKRNGNRVYNFWSFSNYFPSIDFHVCDIAQSNLRFRCNLLCKRKIIGKCYIDLGEVLVMNGR